MPWGRWCAHTGGATGSAVWGPPFSDALSKSRSEARAKRGILVADGIAPDRPADRQLRALSHRHFNTLVHLAPNARQCVDHSATALAHPTTSGQSTKLADLPTSSGCASPADGEQRIATHCNDLGSRLAAVQERHAKAGGKPRQNSSAKAACGQNQILRYAHLSAKAATKDG